MSNFKRHMPSDTSLQAIHAALGRLWDAIEAQPQSSSTSASTPRQLGATVSFSASTPSATKHNDLLGIQGGDVDNYYHVTKVEYDGTGSGVLARQTSPALLGVPTAPTAAIGDNSQTLGTTAFLKQQPTFYTAESVVNADHTIAGSNGRMVMYSALTAGRTLTLPAATQMMQTIMIMDEDGSCNLTNSITLVASGTDKIEGNATRVLNYPYAALTIESNGSGGWIVVANPNPSLSAGVQVAPTFTDNGDGSITFTSGLYCFYTNSTGIGKIKRFTLPGNTFTLTDNTNQYIVADYNAGSPTIYVTTNVAVIDEITVIPLYTVYRRGTVLHVLEWDSLGDALGNKTHKSIVKTQRFRTEPGGLGLGEAATRLVTVGSGTVWHGAVSNVLSAFNSSVNTMWLAYHVAGVWTFSTITQYNNTQWDDGTNLQTLPGGKYAVNFIYRVVGTNDTTTILFLGQGAYSLGDAQASQPPANLPAEVLSHAILVGRIIVNQGGATATQIDSAFATLFTPGGVTDHNALLNLQGGTASQYYHLTSTEYTGTGTGPFARQTSPALLGTPTAPTPATADNSTTIATTAYVQSQGYATGTNWGIQKAVVDVAENMLVPVNYQHHILKTFTVYGTMTVNGESYVFDGVN